MAGRRSAGRVGSRHLLPTINRAVERILTLKSQLGLFDHPLVNASQADAAVTAGRADTLRAAQESVTLLRNQNSVLPLAKPKPWPHAARAGIQVPGAAGARQINSGAGIRRLEYRLPV